MHVQDFEVLDVDMWEDSREASQDEGAELHEGSEPSEDSEPEEEEASRENTIKLLEDMVVDFLEQLSDALPSADNPKPKKADNKKVIMQLADRRKPVKADGDMFYKDVQLFGNPFDFSSGIKGTLIPPSEEISRFEVSEDLSWVLIVEKEAVFQTLCHLDFSSHPSLPGPGVIITGKGYPDVATRQLVCTLSNNLSSTIPIIALVDADPYGIDILSVYKYGSTNMSHEQESLAAPRIRWGGVMSSELAGHWQCFKDRTFQRNGGTFPHKTYPAQPLQSAYRSFALICDTERCDGDRKELQYMLHNRRKAEIEVLSSAPRKSIKRNAREEEDDGAKSADEQPTCNVTKKSRIKTQECILVQYLLTKVTKAVNDCRRKYA
ncbi:hypothetical protein PHLCEN_2v337 [Hermanssonia centrifuga]|uniref:Topoisomerase 6 subunit A/Spo11 TOPRIM domain-containing protein n=1 Tax=Hermanssonia centrifuga TaxID=98765 RepID=A0A2R6S6P4_9APHY|nr:hypothetical protein PHLCEN_2v337 [Hermanssonia centrifuga]